MGTARRRAAESRYSSRSDRRPLRHRFQWSCRAVTPLAALPVPGGASGKRSARVMNDVLQIVFAGLVGAVIGSFLNVCIYRLPRRRSVVWPPSACAACGDELSWFDNVPLVSYAALRGRCRSCKAPISVQYPIVEAVTALMFAFAWWYYGPGIALASRLVLGCALIVLFAVDLEHQLLPDAITLPGIL